MGQQEAPEGRYPQGRRDIRPVLLTGGRGGGSVLLAGGDRGRGRVGVRRRIAPARLHRGSGDRIQGAKRNTGSWKPDGQLTKAGSSKTSSGPRW